MGKKTQIIKKAGKAGIRLLSVAVLIGSAGAPALAVDGVDAAREVMGIEGGKEVINVMRSKPALGLATGIVCLACAPAAPAAAVSPALCIACGILIAKTFG